MGHFCSRLLTNHWVVSAQTRVSDLVLFKGQEGLSRRMRRKDVLGAHQSQRNAQSWSYDVTSIADGRFDMVVPLKKCTLHHERLFYMAQVVARVGM